MVLVFLGGPGTSAQVVSSLEMMGTPETWKCQLDSPGVDANLPHNLGHGGGGGGGLADHRVGRSPYLWLVGNGGMGSIISTITTILPFPTNQQ